MKGVYHLREIAKVWGVTNRCAKRRLKSLDARVRLESKGKEFLLIQFCPGGDHFIDMAMTKKYLPGLVCDDAEDPMVAVAKAQQDIKEMLAEVLMRVSA
jgi:hypothetical protein